LNARESGGRRTCIGRSRGHVARKFGKCRLGNGAQCVASRRTSGSRRRPLATSPAVGAYPGCDAGRVVYSSSPLGGISDVKLYDIAAQQTRDVANQPYNEWRPSISGNRVVWQAWPGPDINILGTNLATGQNFTVTDAAENQTAPVISSSTVAWEDVRSDPPRESQIWWRDVATTMPQTGIPVESQVTGPQLLPSLFGRRVVFQNSSTGPWQVYLGQLFFFTSTG
jgi:hypothetical protein